MTFEGEKSSPPRPKKSWSQNFLVDRNIILKIAAEVVSAAGDGPVLELGAGTGALTAELACTCGCVLALERDRDLIPGLRNRFGGMPNVEILEANALTVNVADILERAQHGAGSAECAERTGVKKICVAGNLPYHIASQIIFHLLDERASISSFVLMLQREMADRVVSGPGTKDYGILSVLCSLHTAPRLLFNVPSGAFRPRPRVESAVVRFDVRDRPAVGVRDEALFKRVVKAAFNQRRKTLKNALKTLAEDAEALDAAFRAAGVDPGRRGETLDLNEFAVLTSEVGKVVKDGSKAVSTD